MQYLKNEILKLQHISDGIFLPQIIYRNKNDRFKFNRLKQLHPNWITLYDEKWHKKNNFRVQIIALNYSKNGHQFSKKDVLQRIIWSSFCANHGLKKIFFEEIFKLRNKTFLLDPISKMPPKEALGQTIITIPTRKKTLMVNGFLHLEIPIFLQKEWVQRPLSQLLTKEELPKLGDPWESIIDDDLKSPLKISSLHNQKLSYPGILIWLTGKEKMEQDLYYFETKERPNEGYRFGVWEENLMREEEI